MSSLRNAGALEAPRAVLDTAIMLPPEGLLRLQVNDVGRPPGDQWLAAINTSGSTLLLAAS